MNRQERRANKRIREIDIAKGIGIILVVLGHLENLSEPVWKQFAASFHMPLFFFIYGVIGYRSNATRSEFVDFAKKRFCRILIPYFLWAIIYSWNKVSIKQMLMILYANNKTFAEAGLWFLPTMFLSECVFYLIMVAKGRFGKPAIYVSGFMCAYLSYFMNRIGTGTIFQKYGYPFSFDIAMTAVVFMLCGSIFRDIYIYNIVPNAKGKIKLFLPVVVVLFVVVFALSRININYITDFAFNRVVMARASYGVYPLFLIGGVIGSVAVLILSCYFKPLKLLEYVGQNSLIYMCTNHVSIAVFMKVFESFAETESLQPIVRGAWCLIALYVVIILCTVVSYIINRYLPILNGKWGKEK